MKTWQHTEFWYATSLGLADCLVAVPIGFFSYYTFTDGSHGAILGWPVAIAALLLLSWAGWCCAWEVLLLQLRRTEPARSETTPLVIFCSGLAALLLATSLAVAL